MKNDNTYEILFSFLGIGAMLLIGFGSLSKKIDNLQTDSYGKKITHTYEKYYEYNVYNSDTIPCDTVLKQIN